MKLALVDCSKCTKVFFFQLQLNPEKDYEYREVIQKPLAPAYSEVLERMKTTSLKHSSVKVEYDKKKD